MTLPAPVALGDPLPAPTPSAELLNRLAVRRSAPAQALTAPGPDDDQIADILTLAARTPDHGKLFPWRFVVMGPVSRAEIAEKLAIMALEKSLPPKATSVLAKLVAAPVTILVISTPVLASKPVWEQELSAGAVCMNLEHAVGGFGYSASWITDWYAYDAQGSALFGVQEGEKIAGFIHIGTLAEPLLERPRPDLSAKVTRLP